MHLHHIMMIHLHIVKLLHEDSSTQNLYDETIPRRKASTGTDGNFCMCAKPKLTNYFDSYEYINGNDNDIEEANNRYFSSHNNKKKTTIDNGLHAAETSTFEEQVDVLIRR